MTVVLTERMYGELAAYAALLSARPMRRGQRREYSPEDALLLAAMLYIEECLYQERRAQASRPPVAGSPPG